MSEQNQSKSNDVQQGVNIQLPVCHAKTCLRKDGRVIKDLCYVFVQPCLIIQRYLQQIPPIFKSPEHAANYNVGMSFHTVCWEQELRDHGVTLYDVTKLSEIYKQAIVPGAETKKRRPVVGQPAPRPKRKNK